MSPPLCSLLLLALSLRLAGTLNPSDPNTCSFWESFTTTTKESHSRPFSLLPSEPCDRPWESPHACPRPTVVYKTVYRQVVKMAHRRRLQCCRGFYESSGACVPLCAQECVHGRCVAPNQCQCVQDWRGDDCSSACAPGVWGPQCDKPCSCGNSSSCDPKSGACSCPSGLQPPHCLQPCSPGHYGPACQFRCQCHGAPCDPQTGACFCTPERTGPSCEVSCLQGSVGFSCPSTYPCHNGGVFQARQGSCSCPPGWMGTICSLPCREGFHGPNCSQECRCHNGGLCDRFTGQCRCAPGYTGDRCREECPVGYFGQDCAETCDCVPGARCFSANGACLCEHGFTGDRCAERLCPDGLYGLSCQVPCTCDPEHSLSCHPMSGECSCLPGWAGLHCNESCPQDTHGPGCQEHCLCLHGGVCQPDSGLCRCAPGYTGPHCASLCPPDSYGVNCSARCSCENAIACSPIDGTCVCKEAASVPMRQPAAHKREPVPAPLGGMGLTASSPARTGSLVKAVPVAVTVTTLMAVTLFMDTASARLAGQAPAATCPALRVSGEPTVATPVPARMGAPASRRMATACVHLDSEAPSARDVRLPVLPLPASSRTWCSARYQMLLPALVSSPDSNLWATYHCGKEGERVGSGLTEGWPCPHHHNPFPPACQPGRYGKRCMPCKCANHSSCHPSDGTCYCLAGWTGPDCSQPCPLGHWGANCSQPCQCRHGGICHPQDGSCFCPPGWTGHFCLEGCSPGMFGANCSQPCQCGPGEKCHPETGACVCPPGHSGAPCRIGSQEPFTMMPTSPVAYSSLGAVIGIAVLGALVVALVAMFIGYRHWQKGKEHQHLAVAYSSGRLDGSEYVMPGRSSGTCACSCRCPSELQSLLLQPQLPHPVTVLT
ncbi:platelet endothelial aggregation receptor 1 isoform X3 [Manis javanica]|uniref:platelet endothelial aggregation receptor 1 isoform X3 n=1 Tax=Manis javanica TaxID=9974 RepID=UPI003C6D77CA